MAESADTVPGPTVSYRIRAVRPLAWVMAFLAAVPFFGLIDMVALLDLDQPASEWDVPLGVSWGSFFTVLLAGPFVWIALMPHRAWPAIVQLGIASFALMISSLAGLDGRPLWVAVPVAGSALLFAWLTSGVAGRFPRSWSLHWPYLILAGAGLVMWIPYALHALGMSRARIDGDITLGIEHWPVQGAAGLALAMCAVAMAMWAPGRPLLRLTVSVSATLIGVSMLDEPDRAGALGSQLWGTAMVIWGTALALPLPVRRSGRVDATHQDPNDPGQYK
ncbi:hypothetical protein [Pseudarthrobacter sp. N5]|uniref:hypothetical protein n=1 Tax=Pseudarthrobacter sp. N5 TaxID=3418416 RepID=UPI003CE76B34